MSFAVDPVSPVIQLLLPFRAVQIAFITGEGEADTAQVGGEVPNIKWRENSSRRGRRGGVLQP